MEGASRTFGGNLRLLYRRHPPLRKPMSDSTETLLQRPKRADARRNYDRLVEAGRAAR